MSVEKDKQTVKKTLSQSQGAISTTYLSEQTIIQHIGNRVFVAAGPLLLLHRLQQEEETVEGEQEELLLFVEEEEGVCVLLRVWENTSQTVDTQLTRYIPQTQDLGSLCKVTITEQIQSLTRGMVTDSAQC